MFELLRPPEISFFALLKHLDLSGLMLLFPTLLLQRQILEGSVVV
jgi:hypothetical protein